MSKHTPGPWKVEIDGELFSMDIRFMLAISVQPIATVIKVYDGSETEEEKQIDLANARLIAAAPDLLLACKVALSSCDPHAASYKYIAAAIEKAEGK